MSCGQSLLSCALPPSFPSSQELRTEALQPALLPVVLPLLARVPPAHFSSALLPVLQPVLESASGETLAALVRGGAALGALMSQ